MAQNYDRVRYNSITAIVRLMSGASNPTTVYTCVDSNGVDTGKADTVVQLTLANI